MAWKETCVMDERMRFVAACLAGDETMAELCRRFGISRKTGYQLPGRDEREGRRAWRLVRGRPIGARRPWERSLEKAVALLQGSQEEGNEE